MLKNSQSKLAKQVNMNDCADSGNKNMACSYVLAKLQKIPGKLDQIYSPGHKLEEEKEERR